MIKMIHRRCTVLERSVKLLQVIILLEMFLCIILCILIDSSFWFDTIKYIYQGVTGLNFQVMFVYDYYCLTPPFVYLWSSTFPRLTSKPECNTPAFYREFNIGPFLASNSALINKQLSFIVFLTMTLSWPR